MSNLAATSANQRDPLAGELALAEAGIRRRRGEIVARVGDDLEPRRIVGQHPWLSTAGAGLVGFAVGRMVFTTRRSRPTKGEAAPAPIPSWLTLALPPMVEVAKLLITQWLGRRS
ncbi:MAG: hypothetical protein JSS27_01975 [Planctomycetes bacterium]|nr:hypothetical protein [Planctomycetota bacterium]